MRLSYFIISVLFLLIAACSTQYDSRLISAEHLIEEFPDSAYSILNEINTLSFNKEADNAKYALLMTQASIKLDIPIESDSLINIAHNYFGEKNDELDRMKALFYHGKVEHEVNNDEYAAMNDVTGAFNIALSLNDNYWIAKSAEFIALLFSNNLNLAEGCKYSKIAASYYLSENRLESYYYNIVDVAVDLAGNNQHDSALTVLNQIKPLSDAIPYKRLLAYADKIKIYSYFELQKYEQVDSVFEEMYRLTEYEPVTPMQSSLMAAAKAHMGDFDAADYYLDMSDSLLTVNQKTELEYKKEIGNIVRAKHMISALRGDFKTAYIFADSLLKISDNIARGVLQDAASLGQRDYFDDMAVQEHRKAENRRLIIMFVVVIAAVVLFAIIIIYRQHIRNKNAELESTINQLQISTEALKNKSDDFLMVDSLKEENAAMAKTIEHLFLGNVERINMLCRQLADFDKDNSLDKDIIIKNLRNELSDICSKKRLAILEKDINLYRDDIMASARRELTMLSVQEFTLLCLIYSGMSNIAIGVILSKNQKSVSMMKSRLRKKIEISEVTDKQTFLDKMP